MKNFFNSIIFIFILLIVFFVINFLPVSKASDVGYQHINGFYDEKKDSIDVVFVGGSNTFSFFLPTYIYEKYGIKTWDYAASGYHFLYNFEMVKEAHKTQPNALYLINFNSIIYPDDYKSLETLHSLTDYMKFNFDKLTLIKRVLEINGLDIFNIIEFIFPIIRYHSQYYKYTLNDIFKKKNGLKSTYIDDFVFDYSDTTNMVVDTKDRMDFDNNLKPYFYEMIEFLNFNNIKYMFFCSPCNNGVYEHKCQINSFIDFLKENNQPYLNLYEYTNEIGLDFTTDYHNGNHTNIYGAKKVSDFVSKYLITNKLIDQDSTVLNDKVDETWDFAVKKYHELIDNKIDKTLY